MSKLSYGSFLELAMELGMEKDLGKIFRRILTEVMTLTDCDAGTLYILEGDKLHFNYMVTKSLKVDKSAERGEIDIPPVLLRMNNVCAKCARKRKLIKISNMYESEEYDFSGAKQYDKLTGYITGSMLVAPMLDDNDNCIGVLQLINKLSGENILPFTAEDEWIVMALASFAAISLRNQQYKEELGEAILAFEKIEDLAKEKAVDNEILSVIRECKAWQRIKK